MNVSTHISWRVARVSDWVSDAQRRQPLLSATALFVAGVVCGYRWGAWPAAACGALVCGLARVSTRAWPAARAAAGWGAVLLLGWCDAAWDDAGRARDAARLKERGARQAFVCRVGQEVSVTPRGEKGGKFTFSAERLRGADDGEGFRFLPAEVTWYGARCAEETTGPQPGQVWRLVGNPAVKRGRDGRLAVTVSTGEERAWKVSEPDLGAWRARVNAARHQAARRVTIGIEDWGVVPTLNQAMLLGCRSEIPREMRRVFSNSGTIHVFAISGLNIALVAGLLIVVVAALGVPRPYWVLGVAPLLVFYTAASGAQPSAVRACAMAIIYFAAPLFGRKPDGLSALCATALLVYAWSPHLVFNIGCTLSFAVMAGLVAFCAPFCRGGRAFCRVGLLECRATLLKQAGNLGGERRLRWLITAACAVIDTVAVSLAAWLASLPLTAYYFERFTPGGFVANLVIAPCAFLVMVGGCLGLAASAVSDWAASCFNHAAGLFTVVMVRTAELTAACPWANFRIARWEPWMVWAWFAALTAAAVWLRARRPSDGLAWLDGTEPGWR